MRTCYVRFTVLDPERPQPMVHAPGESFSIEDSFLKLVYVDLTRSRNTADVNPAAPSHRVWRNFASVVVLTVWRPEM